MKILLKNGYLVDPIDDTNEVCDILIEDSRILQIAKNINIASDKIIDATNKIIMPGIVDLHVHLREPGGEDKETIASGTKAALKGGITSLLAMPNTHPPIDNVDNLRLLKKIIKETAHSNVFIAGSITKARLGKELTEIAKLKKEGIVAISDDGASVDSDELMLAALQKAKKEKVLVICHCEDKSISAKGVVNLGLTSTRLGLRGISNESEYKRVQRDIRLAEKINYPVHIAHVSCRESIELIAGAKKKGIKISAETAPHYFSLSEEAVLGYDTNMKMNPPLRSKDDVEAIKEGLKDGTIDVIASDHAPHTDNEKDIEFERAEFGVVGLETILAASITELVKRGLLNWATLARKLSLNPAKILGINRGSLKVGAEADLVVVSADKEWVVEKERFISKSKNSAFLGKALTGVVDYTILSGKIVYKNKDANAH